MAFGLVNEKQILTPQEIFALVKDELGEVENEFVRQSDSPVRTIAEIGRSLQ